MQEFNFPELPFQDDFGPSKTNDVILTTVNSQPLEGTPFIAPFVPVNMNIAEAAVAFAQLQPNDIVMDLGCGDGRILALIQKSVQKVIGVEYDIKLVEYARMKHPQIEIIHADMFDIDLDFYNVTCLILYLLPEGLSKLVPKLSRWIKMDFKVITIGYSIPNLSISETLEVEHKGSFMGGAESNKQKIFKYTMVDFGLLLLGDGK
jgi:SAM-dependent methyltransferase